MIYQGLETAIIIMRIEASKEIKNKEGHHRIRNFLKVVPEPIEIQRFKGTGTQKGKGLSIEERAKYILPAPVKLFNTSSLVTHQALVIKKNLLYFLERPTLCASRIQHKHYGMMYPLVMHCASGLHVYDGNHRANINHLRELKHKAKYVDLRFLSD